MFKISAFLVGFLSIFFSIASMHRGLDDWCYQIRGDLIKESIANKHNPISSNAMIKIVNNCIQSGFKINAQNTLGETALMIAIIRSDEEVAEALLTRGADVLTKDKKGNTSLHYAASRDSKNLVKFLIQRGVEINAQNNFGNTPLICAIDGRQSYTEIVEMLIEHGADINCKNKQGATALSAAIKNDHVWITRLLLDNNVHVDENHLSNAKKWESYPYNNKFRDTMRLLHQRAAAENDKRKNLLSVFFEAVKNNDPVTVKAYINSVDVNHLEDVSNKTALTMALEQGFFEIADILIANSADLNMMLKDGYTALTKAASLLDKSKVEFLLSRGASIDGINANGKDPLISVLNKNYVDQKIQEEIALLILKQANSWLPSNYPALRLAAKRGLNKIVELLIEAAKSNRNIDLAHFVNAKNEEGETALFFGNYDTIEFLLANNADINVQNEHGDTLLIKAVKKGHIDLANFLLDRQADINKRNLRGHTALTYAIMGGYSAISDRLISGGANIDSKNYEGNTLLLEAALKKQPKVVEDCIKYGANEYAKTVYGATTLAIARHIHSRDTKEGKELFELLETSRDTLSESRAQNNWAEDDVVSPNKWECKNPEDYNLPDIFNDDVKIRKRDYYNPLFKTGDALIIWIVIHGTWGTETPSYYDDRNQEDQNYRNIKRSAANYATLKGRPLELLSYLWQGHLTDSARMQAAENLQKFLANFDFDQSAEIVLLCHSHGCNVANYLTRLISPENPIHLLIYFACPRKKEEMYQPKNYKHLVYFFSNADWPAVVGRANEQEAFKEAMLDVLIEMPHETMTKLIYGKALSYKGYKFKKLFDGLNEFATPDEKITIGCCVKINGKSPGHSELINITKFLPEIIEKIHEHFTSAYSRSSLFHLNIDEHSNYNICLVIAKNGKALAPNKFDYLVKGNKRNCIINAHDIDDFDEIVESNLSKIEANNFKKKYGQKIEFAESSIEQTIYENFSEIYHRS